MSLTVTSNIFTQWSKTQFLNRWADYIELKCLLDMDHIISIDDFYDFFIDESQESLRGTADHTQVQDHNYATFGQYFDLIKYRSEHSKDLYPFIHTNKCIEMVADFSDLHLLYIFLLIASNLTFVNASDRYHLSHGFEDLCCCILKSIVPAAAVTELFGTSRETGTSPYRGNLRQRITQLAKNLHGLTTKSFDSDVQYDVPAGDGGLDIVSYHSIYDTNPFVPITFAQCACSYEEWANKQWSVSYEKWHRRIEGLAPYIQFTFVPFYCRDAGGAFERITDISSCLIDRYRILELARCHPYIVDTYKGHPISEMVKRQISE